MFGIGDFARLGRVSVRSPRDHDAIGPLVPAQVDPATDYRFYEAAQRARLNRIVARLDLGFTLHKVAEMLDGSRTSASWSACSRLQRAEVEARTAADVGRLTQLEARIQLIRGEGLSRVADTAAPAKPARST